MRRIPRSERVELSPRQAVHYRPPAHSHLASGALGLFLFLLIYDGAIRKWLIPGSEQLVFIAKDVLLAGVLLFLVFDSTRSIRSRMPIFVLCPLGLYAVWVLVEILNPNLPNLLVGIWGSKSHLLYAALILVVPRVFTCLDNVFRTLTRIYPWIVIPVCGLAFLQLTLPADSLLNQQVRGGINGISYFGEDALVRVAGPFSYISGMAAFVQASVLAGVALFLWKARSPTFLLGLGFALTTPPATGSRAVVAVAAVGSLIMLLAGLTGRLIGARMAIRSVSVLAVPQRSAGRCRKPLGRHLLKEPRVLVETRLAPYRPSRMRAAIWTGRA